MRRLVVLVLVVLVVLAGCGSQTGTDTTANGTATSTEAAMATPTPLNTSIEVRDGTLPVNATRVFAEVRTVLGSDVDPPEAVVVRNETDGLLGTDVRPFWRSVGVDSAEPTGPLPLTEAGYTTGLGNIVVTAGPSANASTVRMVLAHEFVHYVQLAEGRDGVAQSALGGTTDARFAYRALVEGIAVDTTDTYLDRYHPETRSNVGLYADLAAIYPAGSAQRYANAQYVEGAAYVAARLDDPARSDALYENPPRTGEQVLHNLSAAAEPARPLSVAVSANDYVESSRDTLGEPFVRTALAGAVDEEDAATAAAGWGNDSLVAFGDDGDVVGYAWTLRWDDAANASEARNTFAVLLASLPGDSRLVAVDDETFVVLRGTTEFVERTSASGSGDSVRIDAP